MHYAKGFQQCSNLDASVILFRVAGHLMWLPVRGFTRPLRTLVAITSGEKLEIPDNPPESREGSGNYLISHYIVY